MKVDKETLQKIAHLSRLGFDPAEEEKILQDFNSVLEWIDQLQKIDTSHVDPLIHLSEEKNNFREDDVKPSLDHQKGLQNAPKKDSDYFRVPKLLD